MGSQPMGSLYFRSSDFDSLPKSDCKLSNQVPSKQSHCNISNPYAISTIRVQSQQSDCNPPALQSDCGDCCWIAEFAVGLRRLQSPTRRWMTNCICKLRNFCSLIVEIAVGLWRLQLDCGDCSWIVEIAVTDTPLDDQLYM